MFGTSIMDYSARLQIAKHGFESVTAAARPRLRPLPEIAERHGIEISARRIKHVLDQVEREQEETLGLAPRPRADHLARCCASPA